MLGLQLGDRKRTILLSGSRRANMIQWWLITDGIVHVTELDCVDCVTRQTLSAGLPWYPLSMRVEPEWQGPEDWALEVESSLDWLASWSERVYYSRACNEMPWLGVSVRIPLSRGFSFRKCRFTSMQQWALHLHCWATVVKLCDTCALGERSLIDLNTSMV